MKKILFVIYSMEKAGGSERVVANVANELSKMESFNVTVIPLFGHNSYFTLSERVFFSPIGSTKSKNIFVRGKILINMVNSLSPDYIIGISIGKLNIFLWVCSWFFKRKVKMVASEHIAFSSVNVFTNVIKKLAYKSFHTIAVLTTHDLTSMIDRGFNRVKLVRNSSSYFPDDSLLVPILRRDNIVLAIGRLEDQKGFDRLIEAWSMVYEQHPDWILKIVGEGSLHNKLCQLVNDRFKNPTACQILPFDSNINHYYNNSQLFVVSSLFEGLPMVMIEAICFCIPCISFDCETGPREIIKNKKNGILVKDGDIHALSRSISDLISDESLRETFSIECLTDRNKYEPQYIIKEWIKMLN